MSSNAGLGVPISIEAGVKLAAERRAAKVKLRRALAKAQKPPPDRLRVAAEVKLRRLRAFALATDKAPFQRRLEDAEALRDADEAEAE